MKRWNIYIPVLIVMIAVACSKSSGDTNSNPPPPPPPPPSMTDTNGLQGTFTNGAHTTTGKARIINNGQKLYLENFKTDDGPDLYVYLSTNTTASSFVNLGKLKATTGNQEYVISNNPDLSKYKYVLIWCQQFGVLFGSAELMNN